MRGGKAAEGHAGGDLIVGNKQVAPGVLGCSSGLLAPSDGGAGFGEDGLVRHFGSALGFAEVFAGFGFDDEIRLVDAVVVVADFQIFLESSIHLYLEGDCRVRE